MPKPTIRIHNVETGEVIDREMTASEFTTYTEQLAIDEAKAAEEQTKSEAKSALLQRLGITAEEATLLLS
jgi:hypothetical protein